MVFVNDTEFKYSEQLAELREVLNDKQRIIENTKVKHA
jgi:chromosome segregation ATPase